MWEHVCGAQMCTSGQLHHPPQGALAYPLNAWEPIQGSQGTLTLKFSGLGGTQVSRMGARSCLKVGPGVWG